MPPKQGESIKNCGKRPMKNVSDEGGVETRYDTFLFANLEQATTFDGIFASRGVISGRNVNFYELRDFGFDNLFKRLGWMPIFTTREAVYHRLVRLFYSNLTYLNECQVESFVKGKKIRFSPTELCGILGIPSDGAHVFELKNWPATEDFEPLEACRRLCDNPQLVGILKLNAKHLTLKARILHHMVGYNILPKAGHRDDVSFLEVFVVDSMLVGRRFNLGYMLIRHMVDSRDHKTAFLPYGMILTKNFKHFKVPMDDEVDFSRPIATDTYNKSKIRRMGYREVGGVWIPKASLPPEMARNGDEEEAEDEMNGMEQRDGSEPQPDVQQPFGGEFGERLGLCSARLEALSTAVEQLGTKLDDLRADSKASHDELRGHFDTLMDALDSRLGDMLEFLSRHFPPPSASF